MVLLALLEVSTRILSIFQIVVFGGMGIAALGLYGYILLSTTIIWMVLFVITLRLWIKSRTRIMNRRALTAPAVCMLVVYTIPAAIDIVWFFLI